MMKSLIGSSHNFALVNKKILLVRFFSFAPKILFFVFLFLFFNPPELPAKGRKPPKIEFSVFPSTVTTGKTLAVWCRSSDPIKNTALYFQEKKALFYPMNEGHYRALIGISSQEKPGKKEATFYTEFQKGRVFQSTVSFIVQEGTYPTRHLSLPNEKERLITSGKISRDAKILREIYNNYKINEKLWVGYFIMPTTGVISSVYGARRSYGKSGYVSAHSGVDIANRIGTEIVAPNKGLVVYADWLESFGNTIVLDHGQGIFSYYLHMSQLKAERGQLVEKGMLIGLIGEEGLVTGPHLHWSFVVAGERVDAIEWTERVFD